MQVPENGNTRPSLLEADLPGLPMAGREHLSAFGNMV